MLRVIIELNAQRNTILLIRQLLAHLGDFNFMKKYNKIYSMMDEDLEKEFIELAKIFYKKVEDDFEKKVEEMGIKEGLDYEYFMALPNFYYTAMKLFEDEEIPNYVRLMAHHGLSAFFTNAFKGNTYKISYESVTPLANQLWLIINEIGEDKVLKYWKGKYDMKLSLERHVDFNYEDKTWEKILEWGINSLIKRRERTKKNKKKRRKKKKTKK